MTPGRIFSKMLYENLCEWKLPTREYYIYSCLFRYLTSVERVGVFVLLFVWFLKNPTHTFFHKVHSVCLTQEDVRSCRKLAANLSTSRCYLGTSSSLSGARKRIPYAQNKQPENPPNWCEIFKFLPREPWRTLCFLALSQNSCHLRECGFQGSDSVGLTNYLCCNDQPA